MAAPFSPGAPKEPNAESDGPRDEDAQQRPLVRTRREEYGAEEASGARQCAGDQRRDERAIRHPPAATKGAVPDGNKEAEAEKNVE